MSTSKDMDERKQKKLIWVIVILLVCVIALLVYLLHIKSSSQPAGNGTETIGETAVLPSAGAQEKPDETEEEDTIKVSLEDSRTFAFDNLSFRFVIARIHVESSSPINITLDHFRTSEGINLGNVNSYVTALEANNYFLGRQNVWFSIVSEDTSCDANIFIPVNDSSLASVTVSSDFAGNKDIVLDLSNPTGTEDMLKYQADDVITDGKTYQMKVSKAFDITGDPFYQTVNGTDEEYYLPSTTKEYAFKVEVVSTWGDPIVLEAAQYVPEGSEEVFDAMDETIHTEKLTNLLGRTVQDNDTGYLLFYAYNPDTNPITYTGVLKVKLKGNDTWITINVDLS